MKRPNCDNANCGHSVSFHGSGGPCRALGCRCTGYQGLTRLGHSTMSVEEAMFILAMTREQVLALDPDAVGLRQEAVRDLSVGQPLDDKVSHVWRLDRTKVEGLRSSKNP